MPSASFSGFAYVKSSGGFDEYHLKSNDLTILLKEDHTFPIVGCMVTYRVGSRNEATGYTGATHLLEHLMFKGSEKFNKENNLGIFDVLEDRGAKMNATTWLDRTNYYAVIASKHLEKVLEPEADRMRGAYIKEDDRRSEMTVVRNEYERGENNPQEALDKALWASAYIAHPYHHSTIGWRSDIENVPIERLKSFYDTFYWPNNATLTVIGDIDVKETLEKIKKYFGDISRSPEPIPSIYTMEPLQEGKRTTEVNRPGRTNILGIAHKTPPGLHPDMHALTLLSLILSGGKSSRLYTALVDRGLASKVEFFFAPFKDAGLMIAYVFLTEGTSHESAERIVLREYARLKRGVTEKELETAKALARSTHAFSQDGALSILGAINEAIAVGDWTLYTTFPEKISAVTAENIVQVAKTYLVDRSRTTGYLRGIKNHS